MGIVNEQLHLYKDGEQIDIALTDDKEMALGTDSGDGTCLSVFMNGRVLYAATNDKKNVPDIAPLALKDGLGNIRYVHKRPGTKTPVLYATYTGSFSLTSLDFPFGGYIVARASNGSNGTTGGSDKDGGASGYGGSVNVDGTSHVVPSGGGGGGGGTFSGTKPSGYTNISNGRTGEAGSGGKGSTVTINIEEGSHSISASVGRNYGDDGKGLDGGVGGSSWPSSSASATLHKGSSGSSATVGRASYMGRTYSYGRAGSGARGGYGYDGIEEVSQSTYSVQIYRYLYI
ncbi:MAG: hypothetical protein IJJ66_11210 [Treponema sp.]|nr:hypothetical protein [Treponema sp.]MBR0477374.1 hypothetical protein [Treponema sp.]